LGRDDLTSNIRYRIKMYRVGLGLAGGNESLAREYAEALNTARLMGVGSYEHYWEVAEGVVRGQGVPRAYYGLYRSFTSELIKKAQRQRVASVEEIIEKWTKNGLDPKVLRMICERIFPGYKVEPEQSSQ